MILAIGSLAGQNRGGDGAAVSRRGGLPAARARGGGERGDQRGPIGGLGARGDGVWRPGHGERRPAAAALRRGLKGAAGPVSFTERWGSRLRGPLGRGRVEEVARRRSRGRRPWQRSSRRWRGRPAAREGGAVTSRARRSGGSRRCGTGGARRARCSCELTTAAFRWRRAATAWTTARGDSERRVNACA